jgi:DnaK suppressor protein
LDVKKLKATRERLSIEYETLCKSINRKRTATNEIKVENTEDDGDLASISHDRDLLYNLRESDFARVRFIEEALKAIERGQYGECARCGDDINEKRLQAVPWATLCIGCQEATEAKNAASRMVLAGEDVEETDF